MNFQLRYIHTFSNEECSLFFPRVPQCILRISVLNENVWLKFWSVVTRPPYFGLTQISSGTELFAELQGWSEILGGKIVTYPVIFNELAHRLHELAYFWFILIAISIMGAGSALSQLLHSHYRTRTPEKYNRIRVKVTSGTELVIIS